MHLRRSSSLLLALLPACGESVVVDASATTISTDTGQMPSCACAASLCATGCDQVSGWNVQCNPAGP